MLLLLRRDHVAHIREVTVASARRSVGRSCRSVQTSRALRSPFFGLIKTRASISSGDLHNCYTTVYTHGRGVMLTHTHTHTLASQRSINSEPLGVRSCHRATTLIRLTPRQHNTDRIITISIWIFLHHCCNDLPRYTILSYILYTILYLGYNPVSCAVVKEVPFFFL